MIKNNAYFGRINKYQRFIVLFISCLFAATGLAKQLSHEHKKNTKADTWITIFIHGITSTRPHLNLANVVRFMRNDIDDTHYKEAVEHIRNDCFCYNGQAMQGPGLHKINLQKPSSQSGACAIARLFDRVNKHVHPNTQVVNHYYTYGWSALIGAKERKEGAKALYKNLVALKKKYNTQNDFPKIRLIGYSHGGNVMLALGSLKNINQPKIIIDQAITLGMPVNKEEHSWIHSPIFKKVYHIYSRSDRIQRLDLFTNPGRLSAKRFKNYRRLKLPQNFTQIEIRAIRPTRGTKKNKSAFYNRPSIISGKGRTLRNASPGHIELWFFGWAAEFYRKDFILYPLPYVTLLPLLLEQSHQLSNINPKHPVIIDIRPHDEKMIIRKANSSYKSAQVVPFLPLREIEELKVLAYKAKPLNYSRKKHRRRIKKISHTVRLEREQRKRKRRHIENNTKDDSFCSVYL